MTTFHTQLFFSSKSWNLKEVSPAVSLPICSRSSTLLALLSSESPSNSKSLSRDPRGAICGGHVDIARALMLPTFKKFAFLSQRNTCMMIGARVWRWRDSFWLSETVSKQRIAPVIDTIQGRTFWFDILDTTRSLDDLEACSCRLLSPDRVEGTSSFPWMTDDMYMNPCLFKKNKIYQVYGDTLALILSVV